MDFRELDDTIERFFKDKFGKIHTSEYKFTVFALYVIGIMGFVSCIMFYATGMGLQFSLYMAFCGFISIFLGQEIHIEGVLAYKQKECL